MKANVSSSNEISRGQAGDSTQALTKAHGPNNLTLHQAACGSVFFCFF